MRQWSMRRSRGQGRSAPRALCFLALVFCICHATAQKVYLSPYPTRPSHGRPHLRDMPPSVFQQITQITQSAPVHHGRELAEGATPAGPGGFQIVDAYKGTYLHYNDITFKNVLENPNFADQFSSWNAFSGPQWVAKNNVQLAAAQGVLQQAATQAPAGTQFALLANASVSAGQLTLHVGFYDPSGYGAVQTNEVSAIAGAPATYFKIITAPVGAHSVQVWAKARSGDAVLSTLAFGPVSRGGVAADFTSGGGNCIAPDALGINLNYFRDTAESRARGPTLLGALRDINTKFLRFPGGEKSDDYLWATPPYTQPRPALSRLSSLDFPANDSTIYQLNNNAFMENVMTFDDFIDFTKQLGATPSLVLNYDSVNKPANDGGTALGLDRIRETALAWVSYARSKGFSPAYWEIGNECYLISYNGYATGGQYAATVADWAKAIRAIDPGAKIAGNGPNFYDQASLVDPANAPSWYQTLLTTAGSAIDWLSLHYYPIDAWKSYAAYSQAAFDFASPATEAGYALERWAPGDAGRIQIAMTETGPTDWDHVDGEDWPQHSDAGHLLVMFDYTATLLAAPRVRHVLHWCTRWYADGGTPRDALNAHNEASTFGRMLAFIGRHLDTGCYLNATSTMTVKFWALKIGGGVKLLFVNKGPDTIQQAVTLANYQGPTQGQLWTFAGASDDDQSPSFAGPVPVSIAPPQFTLQLPPFSASVAQFSASS